jgi:hypothetical protein
MGKRANNDMQLPISLLSMLNAMKDMVPTGPLGAEINGRIARIAQRLQDVIMQMEGSPSYTAESLRNLQSILETMKELAPMGVLGDGIRHEIDKKALEVRDLLRRIRSR